MPKVWDIAKEIKQIDTRVLLAYIEEDIENIRFRLGDPTGNNWGGQYPDGVSYDPDLPPSVLIAIYAAELQQRGL